MSENSTLSIGLLKSFANTLTDPSTDKDEVKLRALHELYENIEKFSNFSEYPSLLDFILNIFIQYLSEGEPVFISEIPKQKIRKSLLEILNRLPLNVYLKNYYERILSLMFKLFEIDNEENVLLCLRLIIEYYKFFKPQLDNNILRFLELIKTIFMNLKDFMPIMVESKTKISVNNLADLDLNELLKKTFVSLEITTTEVKEPDGGQTTVILEEIKTYRKYNLKPKSILSLKILQEIPILIIIILQYLKTNLSETTVGLIPMILQTISLQPTPEQMSSPNFNRNIYVEFIAVQVKGLSFLAFILKDHLDLISQNRTILLDSIISLVTNCPVEIASVRRELLIAIKHIFMTPLKMAFVPYMKKLLDERILLNTGWTVNEALRPLAFQTLADLTHHIRDKLTLDDQKAALNLFFCNIQDDTLASSIQIVSCKVVLNLVDYIKAPIEDPNIDERIDMLTRILECFVIRLKVFYKSVIAYLVSKYKNENGERLETEVRAELIAESTRNGFPTSTPINYLHDYKAVVKTLISGLKTITWGLLYCKNVTIIDKSEVFVTSVPLQTTEVRLFTRLVKWGMHVINIYALFAVNYGQRNTPVQKNVEEREVIEHFSSQFVKLNPLNFQEIFSEKIDFVIQQVNQNPSFLLMIRTFLSEKNVSQIFAKILMKHLLDHIDEIGSNHEKSELYSQLLISIFNYVTLPNENGDELIRPYLSQIVTKSIHYALISKDPSNYFIMLRSLFRSIGGGNHDILYTAFLPLLPNLLETFNRLQSGIYRQSMKDVLIELCLTIPVRLSTFLPYIPMLMDPLVTALNETEDVISQGLRTLELCVNNLQPFFLYNHIQPITVDLMHALWRIIRNTDANSQVAFRILGKLGGNNRRILTEPQEVEYIDEEHCNTHFFVNFPQSKENIPLIVDKIIDEVLKKVTSTFSRESDREHCWNIIYSFLFSTLNLSDKDNFLYNFFSNPFFTQGIIPWLDSDYGKQSNSGGQYFRKTHLKALQALFFMADLKQSKVIRLKIAAYIVQHYVMISLLQQIKTPVVLRDAYLDASILVDAITNVLILEVRILCRPGYELEDMTYFDKNDFSLWKFGYLSLYIILATAKTLLGSKKRACQLPLINYLSESLCKLCYERSWMSKMAGCIGIQFLYKNLDIDWVFENLNHFIKAVTFVFVDLIDEITCGVLVVASAIIKDLILLCVSSEFIDSSMHVTKCAQKKALHDLTAELVSQVTSPHTVLREEAIKGLRLLALKQGILIGDLIGPHKDLLADIIPPKKHLLRQQSVNAQIGLMEGYTFCASFNPKLYTIDLSVKEHMMFYLELKAICEKDEAYFSKLGAYKNLNNLSDLKKSAYKALATCYYFPKKSADEVFGILFKNLDKWDADLQEAVFKSLKDFIEFYKVPAEIVLTTMKKVFASFENYNDMDLVYIKRIVCLFPTAITEKFCEKLLIIFKDILTKEIFLSDEKPISKENKIKVNSILEIFCETPSITADHVINIIDLLIKAEKKLMLDVGSPFRQNLVNVILRHPLAAVNHFFNFLSELQYISCFTFVINHKKAKLVRESIENPMNVQKCINMLTLFKQISNFNLNDQTETRFQTIKIIAMVTKHDQQWISEQYSLINVLKDLWYSDDYHNYHRNVENISCRHWEEPKFLAAILMQYFTFHPNDIELAFQLMRAFCMRFVCSFPFLQDFFENSVAKNYTTEWKRSAFLKFVSQFESGVLSKELTSKIVQIIIIPSFYVAFERNEGHTLLNIAVENEVTVLDICLQKLFDVDNPLCNPEHVRIPFLQLACLMLEKASEHIHNSANKNGNVRRMLTFAWPCLLNESCFDASNKYYGHLLLAHIAAKFAISKKIVSRIFFGLLKAHVNEARSIVKLALDVLTPLMPSRIEDGFIFMAHWTKKIMVEEGHCGQQLYHILYLIVKHYRICYPVRHFLIQHLLPAMNKAAISSNSSLENRRLAIDVGEVILRWETERIRKNSLDQPEPAENEAGIKIDNQILKDQDKPVDRSFIENLFNFFIRYPCQKIDTFYISLIVGFGENCWDTFVLIEIIKYPANSQPTAEFVLRRALSTFKSLMKSDLWTNYSIDLKLNQIEKYLLTPNNFYCTSLALELIIFLLNVLTKEAILQLYPGVLNGLICCISYQNMKVIKWMDSFLSKFMHMFPPQNMDYVERVNNRHEEFDSLYLELNRHITDKFNEFVDKKVPIGQIYGPLLHLRTLLIHYKPNADRYVQLAVKVLTRLSSESFPNDTPEAVPQTDLIIICLETIKSRIPDMITEVRKPFVSTILITLVEKFNDYRIFKLILKTVDEWNKSKKCDKSPTFRERTLILSKMFQIIEEIESKHPDKIEDVDIRVPFFDVVYGVYVDKDLKITDFAKKLEFLYLCGLKSNITSVRQKFAELYHSIIPKNLKDRLMFMNCSQNWELMGDHYWINELNEMILSISRHPKVVITDNRATLPPFESVAKKFEKLISFQEDDFVEMSTVFTSDDSIDFNQLMTYIENDEVTDRHYHLGKLIKQHTFLTKLAMTVSFHEFMKAIIHLCHRSIEVSESMWLNLFPSVWDVLPSDSRNVIEKEIQYFVLSGSHNVQKNCRLSALNTYVEALYLSKKYPITLKPDAMRFLGKNHNLWHRMIIELEQASYSSIMKSIDVEDCYEFEPENRGPQIDWELLETLSDFYSSIFESDLWSAVWQHRAKYPETRLSITFQQQGFYEQAKDAYDLSMDKFKADYKTASPQGEMHRENVLWEEQYLYCSRQLCLWKGMSAYAKLYGYHSMFLDGAIRFPEKIAEIKDFMISEDFFAAESDWKLALQLGYLSMLSPGDKPTVIDDLVKNISSLCSLEWCRLPKIVSNAHIPILQGAQLIVELQESEVIHVGVTKSNTHFNDVKEVIKTWQGRLPIISDDLSYWDDLLAWRHNQFMYITNAFLPKNEKDDKSSTNDKSTPPQEAIVGRHADAQSNILFGKICRKNNNTKLCMESLEKIYGMEHVPIGDCFDKIRQQVKCFLHMSAMSNTKTEINKALRDISRTKFQYFNNDYKAELFSLKAYLLGLKEDHVEANQYFSLSIQLNDALSKNWALYGIYLEDRFLSDPKTTEFGANAIITLMNGCRNSSDMKCKKYISKILWLLAYDDENNTFMELIRKCATPNISPNQWLIWIPQLLVLLVHYEGDVIMNILIQVGRTFPQAVYYPIRTLYLTLKSEQIERYKNENINENATIPATAAMMKCSKIISLLKDAHPTILLSLEGIGDQVAALRENWYEEMLRLLKQVLSKCYTLAFENYAAVNEAQTTSQTLAYVKKLVSLIDHIPASSSSEAAVKDSTQQTMKNQFKNDFDFTKPNAVLLHNLISKLKKWIKYFEKNSGQSMNSFLIEEKCRFLANFTSKTAEVEMPGEFLTPKPVSHYVRIVRFMPMVELVQKHNGTAHRLQIRGHNGKLYSYLVVYDSVSADARREERVLQLLRLLNEYLIKYKESAKRFLAFTVPKVVSVSPQLCLVEDNPTSLSLLDIFKKKCKVSQIEPDAPVEFYYKSLEKLQNSGQKITCQSLKDIFFDVQSKIVPATILKNWALSSYQSPVDYWHFRKMFTVQMSLSCFAEHILHLTRMNPEMTYLHRNNGMVTVSYFKFDYDLKREFDLSRPVPFRLTPNIIDFMLRLGLDGPFSTTMVATSRCFLEPKYSMISYFRPILKDELLSNSQSEVSENSSASAADGFKSQHIKMEQIISFIHKELIQLKSRLTKLSAINLNEKNGKVVNNLTTSAANPENLCRMDPVWYPWL